MPKFLLLLCGLCFLPSTLFAGANIEFASGQRQIPLLELYTSEGCSSCPPADQWLSQLVDDPRLWKEVIPIAFHVDYWNYIGWRDRFSAAEYSERQRSHAAFGNVRTVYTPGFILNGREWRSWFKRPQLHMEDAPSVGVLKVSIKDSHVIAEFVPMQAQAATLQLNHAWLGFDLVTQVQDGENAGRTLKHDFVSYAWGKKRTAGKNNRYHWEFPLQPSRDLPEKKAIVFWVSDTGNPKPIQAVAGWLSTKTP